MEVLYLSDCRGRKTAITLSTIYKYKVSFQWGKDLLIDIPFYLKKKKFDVVIIDNVGSFKLTDLMLVTLNNLLSDLQVPYIIVAPLCDINYKWDDILKNGFRDYKRTQNIAKQFCISTVHIYDHIKQAETLELARNNIDSFYEKYKREDVLLIHDTPVLPLIFHIFLVELINDKLEKQLVLPTLLENREYVNIQTLPINKYAYKSIKIAGNFALYGFTHERWYGSATCALNDKEIWTWTRPCLISQEDIIYTRDNKFTDYTLIDIYPGQKNEQPIVKGYVKYDGEQYLKLHEMYFSGHIESVCIDEKNIELQL